MDSPDYAELVSPAVDDGLIHVRRSIGLNEWMAVGGWTRIKAFRSLHGFQKNSCCLTDVHLLRLKNARNELLKADLKVFQNIRQNRKLQGNSKTFFPERFWCSLFQICDYLNPCLVDPLRGIRKAPTEPSQKSSIMFSTLFSLFSLYHVYYTFSTWMRPKYILFLFFTLYNFFYFFLFTI